MVSIINYWDEKRLACRIINRQTTHHLKKIVNNFIEFRTRWTPEERGILYDSFRQFIERRKFPGHREIRSVILKHTKILGHRTPAQVTSQLQAIMNINAKNTPVST